MAIDSRSVCHCFPELYDHPTLRTTLIVLCAQYEHDRVWRPGNSGGIRPRLLGIGYSLGTDFATPAHQEMDVIRRIFFCCRKRRDDETQTEEEEQYGKEVQVRPSKPVAFGSELATIRRSEKEPRPPRRGQIVLPTPEEADAIIQDMLKAMAMYRAQYLQVQMQGVEKPSYMEAPVAGAMNTRVPDTKASGAGMSDGRTRGSGTSEAKASGAGMSDGRTLGSGTSEAKASGAGMSDGRTLGSGTSEAKASDAGMSDGRTLGSGTSEATAPGAGTSDGRTWGSGASDERTWGSGASAMTSSGAEVSGCQTYMGDEHGQPANPSCRKPPPEPPT